MIQQDWSGPFQSAHLSQITITGLDPRVQLDVVGRSENFLVHTGVTYSVLTSCSKPSPPKPVPLWVLQENTNRFTQVLLCSWDGQIFFLQFLVVAECPTPFMGRTLSLPLKSCSYWCPDRRFFKTVSWGQTIFTSTKWNNAWMGEAIYGCLIKGSSDIKSADVKSRCDYTPLWDS